MNKVTLTINTRIFNVSCFTMDEVHRCDVSCCIARARVFEQKYFRGYHVIRR